MLLDDWDDLFSEFIGNPITSFCELRDHQAEY
jgi:hypothetical protein